jgi:hypothetical protein
MKKVYSVLLASFILFTIVSVSCKKDSNNKDEGELSNDIKNIVPDSILQKLTQLGMPVNKGIEPMDITGIYEASPFELKATSIIDDYPIGSEFADYKFELYDQDNENLTIKLDYVNGSESGTGLGGFISGSGNDFSVFVKVHAISGDSPADVLNMFSGTITDDGIANLYFSNFMLDNFDNPESYWIDNGTGRVFFDSDNQSPFVDDLYVKAKKNNYNFINISRAYKK